MSVPDEGTLARMEEEKGNVRTRCWMWMCLQWRNRKNAWKETKWAQRWCEQWYCSTCTDQTAQGGLTVKQVKPIYSRRRAIEAFHIYQQWGNLQSWLWPNPEHPLLWHSIHSLSKLTQHYTLSPTIFWCLVCVSYYITSSIATLIYLRKMILLNYITIIPVGLEASWILIGVNFSAALLLNNSLPLCACYLCTAVLSNKKVVVH